MQAVKWLLKKEKHTIRIGIRYLENPKRIITDKKVKEETIVKIKILALTIFLLTISACSIIKETTDTSKNVETIDEMTNE